MDPAQAIKKTLVQLRGVEDVEVYALSAGAVPVEVTLDGRPSISWLVLLSDWNSSLEELISRIEEETH